jgi:hypothetical protein
VPPLLATTALTEVRRALTNLVEHLKLVAELPGPEAGSPERVQQARDTIYYDPGAGRFHDLHRHRGRPALYRLRSQWVSATPVGEEWRSLVEEVRDATVHGGGEGRGVRSVARGVSPMCSIARRLGR